MKSNIKNTLIAAVAIALSGCEKQLNVLPTTSIVDGNVITDSLSAQNALNGVYYRFANAGKDFNSVDATKWSHVFEFYPSELVGSMAPSSSNDEIVLYTFDENASFPSTLWSYGYAVVNAANSFLMNIDPITMSLSAKRQMQGEAKFLRAFANETLLLSFGQYTDMSSNDGIILRTEPVNEKSITSKRATVAACYDLILKDVDEAIANLPEQNRSKLYANKTAAKLLKARVLINRGTEEDLRQVIQLSDQIITQSPFKLEPLLQDLFLKKGFASDEVVLGIQPYVLQNWKFYFYNYSGVYSISKKGISLLEGDPRSNWYYRPDQKGTITGSYIGGINEMTKYYSGPVVLPVQDKLSENSYAFRLSSAYLYKAEALATLNVNLDEAKTLLKEVLSKSGVSDFSAVENVTSGSALKELIIIEQLRNFMNENAEDWYALRRLSMSQIQTIQPLLKVKERLILPIPYSERSRNNLIQQNPGY